MIQRRKRVVIAGGGVASLEALLALRALVGSTIDIVVISPETQFVYRPYAVLLPFTAIEEQRIDLSDIFESHSVQHIEDTLARVEPERQEVVTSLGETVPYDWLLLAHGAQTKEAVAGALTFEGERSVAAFRELLERVQDLEVCHMAFAAPESSIWQLPLYELAIQTRRYASERGIESLKITLVTPDSAPLEIFGAQASSTVRELLEQLQIDLITDELPIAFANGKLQLVPDDELSVDAVVSLPTIVPRSLEGIVPGPDGFLSVDSHTRVTGYENIFAVGDCVSFPIKQGGIATQHSDIAAEAIAAELGYISEPMPFRPVLRGMLVTGTDPQYMRNTVFGGVGEGVISATRPLWWPPSKIAGKYLAPYLANYAGIGLPPQAPSDGVPVDVQIAIAHDESQLDVLPEA